MKIATARQYGSPDVVRIEEIETPKPEADEVLVRVHAASVNRADLDGLYPRWQFLRLFLGVRRPRLPWLGIDLAGTVEAVGPEVTELKPGDRVFGDIFGRGRKTGAFAEYACVSQKALATMPARPRLRRSRLPAARGLPGHPCPYAAAKTRLRQRQRSDGHRRVGQRWALLHTDCEGARGHGHRRGQRAKARFRSARWARTPSLTTRPPITRAPVAASI